MLDATKRALLKFSGTWWYPWLVGLLSGLNSFLIVLSGPLTVLYVSGVLTTPERRFFNAFAHAVGTVLGIAALVYVGLRNEEYFPSFDESWKTTRQFVEDYLFIGVIGISTMPIILHPMIFFSLRLMDPYLLVLCVFIGRFMKYAIMAQMAISGSEYIKFFGSAAMATVQNSKNK